MKKILITLMTVFTAQSFASTCYVALEATCEADSSQDRALYFNSIGQYENVLAPQGTNEPHIFCPSSMFPEDVDYGYEQFLIDKYSEKIRKNCKFGRVSVDFAAVYAKSFEEAENIVRENTLKCGDFTSGERRICLSTERVLLNDYTTSW